MPSRLVFLAALVAALALTLAVSGCGGEENQAAATTETTTAETTTPQTTVPAGAGSGALGGSNTIPVIVEAVSPSVVGINVTGGAGASEGSGVIWDSEGRIVTNEHVIEGADRIEVQLRNGERLRATLVGDDPLTDLALVKVSRTGLPAATFARTLPRVGSLAVAIGNPLGFQNTVTAGIVSGIGRAIPEDAGSHSLVDLLQTDAAISPGNSGGALVGPAGTVIGINVAYIPPQAGAVSLGFAVPSPTVVAVVEQLAAGKVVRHAYLGVRASELSADAAARLGTEGSGLSVIEVVDGSPASEAGIRSGDVIATFGGSRIRTLEQLLSALRRHQPGDPVDVELIRDGEAMTATVTLGDRPDS